MSMKYIRHTYGVPAKRGARVAYTGTIFGVQIFGAIIGSSGARLRVRMDGDGRIRTLHPTWELSYLDTDSKTPSMEYGTASARG